MENGYNVVAISKKEAVRLAIKHHYMHRRPPISFCFGLLDGEVCKGIITFGTPASRHMQIGACPESPSSVLELNRLWVSDDCPKNTESWFIAKAFKLLPPFIILNYADTTKKHMGFVYRASNFYYAGWTDMERRTARFDYITPGMHTRDAFRKGERRFTKRVRRRPKVKYWKTSGNRRDRKRLEKMYTWPKMCWVATPPPIKHIQYDGVK